jgi:DNA primase
MSGQQLPAAHSDSLDPASAGSGQDWAIWLRHACQLRLPTPLAFPGRAEAAWTALTHLARRQGFNVERANCAAADGLTTWRNRTIRIRPDIASPQAVIALAHQLGHVLLHGQIAHLERSGTVPCTGIRKVEADSVAYLTALSTGIDTTTITFPAGSSWAGSDPRARPATTIKAVTARIRTAAAAVNAMLDTAGVTRPPSDTAPGATLQRAQPSVPAEQIIRAHDSAAAFFRSHVQRSWVPAYLASRGLDPEVHEHWLTGYAPAAWDALTSHLRADGYRDAVIEAAGLARRSRRGTLIDTFRDRAMLPIRSPDGTIVAFIGRAPSHAAAAAPKYLNSPSTSVYSKSTVLFGLWEARDALANGARPVLVEGPFDAIAVTIAGSGRHVGVAPCGTALTDRQVAFLAQAADLPAVWVSVAFDPDQPGRRAAVHAYHLLVPLTADLAAVSLPAGQDPAHVLARSGPAGLAAVLTENTRPLPDLVINAAIAPWGRWLRHPEGQIHALRAAAPLIAAMPAGHVARQVARLAAILRLDHATVTQAVTDALTELINGAPSRHPPDAPYSARQAIQHAPEVSAPPSRSKRDGGDRARLTSRARS